MKRTLRVVLWNLGLLLAGALVLELGFGGWIRARRLDHLHLVRNTTEVSRVENLYGPPGGVAVYTRDRYGLRGDYSSPGAIDILTMGGSTTDQRHVDDKLTWQAVLQARFAKDGKRVTVVNAGVDGQTTFGHLKAFDEWLPSIPQLRPRWVLFYVGVNDLFSPRGAHYDQLAGAQPGFGDRVRDNSILYYLVRTALGAWQANVLMHRRIHFEQLRWVDAPLRSDHAALLAGKLDELAERERTLAQKVARMGAQAIWVTQPMRFYKREGGKLLGVADAVMVDGVPMNGVDVQRAIGLLNARTLQVCGETHGRCLDLAGAVDFDDGDFYDYAHNTPAGAAKIGDYLHDQLRALF
jgi:lysophospholipase L1-like esterase